MSDDEMLVLLGGSISALVFWGIWLYRTQSIGDLFDSSNQKRQLLTTPVVCAVILFAILKLYASHDVRDAAEYLLMYQAMGAGWVGVFAVALFPWLGVHYVDDAVERANPAATIAISGGLIGFTLAFAGGNIGDGPGWWVVVFSSGLATLTLAGCWAVLARFAELADEITVDRDFSAGLRLAGFLVAGGMVCGRAAAGNWISAASTIDDFCKVAWVMAPLMLLTWAFDFRGSPNPDRPKPSVFTYGFLPALLCIGLSAVWIAARGGL
jgi:uncharacterized membrane protein YjfL (UPF0719 family)